MPLAEQSIIAPAAIQAKAPIKKSTVAWGLAAIVALAIVGLAIPPLMKSDSGEAPKAAPSAAPRGDADQIDGEFKRARQKAELDAQTKPAAPASVTVPPPPPASVTAMPPLPGASGALPFPAQARREDNSGALYSKQVDGIAGAPAAGGAATIEADAQARQSVSVKFDQSDTGGSTVRQASADRADTGGMPRPAGESRVEEGGTARDRTMAAIEAARRGEQASTGIAADRSWLKEFADKPKNPPLRPYQVTHPYTLLQGKVLPAVLTRDLNSDLPGEVGACTTVDVYDSLSSRYLLIPKGSCLQGAYSNGVRNGQERILFAFSRLILPNGLSIDLPANPGADLGGASGVAGEVDNHFFKMFTTSLLVALLADRAEQGRQGPSVSTGSGGPVSAAGQVLVDVSRTVLDRHRTIPPTIRVAAGTRINVEVTRDMEFPGPYRR